MARYEVVEGWTGALRFTLKSDGVPQNLSGMTVTLQLRSWSTRADVPTTGDVTVTDAAAGEVTYTPDSADLAAGTYSMRWVVVDGSGAIVYYPSSEAPDLLVVGSVTF